MGEELLLYPRLTTFYLFVLGTHNGLNATVDRCRVSQVALQQSLRFKVGDEVALPICIFLAVLGRTLSDIRQRRGTDRLKWDVMTESRIWCLAKSIVWNG